jgi:hypothetical protein
MIQPTLLQDIPVTFAPDALLPRLRLRPGSSEAKEFEELVAQAQPLARPRAAFLVGYIDHKDDEGVVVDGVRFTSRVLRTNLDAAHRAFAYIATCGLELQEWAGSLYDVLHQFWAEEIKVAALRAATQAVMDEIAVLNPGKMASMNPGSLPDWPIQEQKPFFQLLGDASAAIGVTLSDSCLMTPNKSVTGLRFANTNDWVNCRLCTREACPGRAAPYDAAFHAERYRNAGLASQ